MLEPGFRSAAESDQRRGDWAFSWAIAWLGLLPRLYVALAWARQPVWDGYYYHFGAARIAAGLGYSEDVEIGSTLIWKPWAHYPVGYSALLGGVYRLLGSELWVAPVVNAVTGALLVLVVHRLSRHYLGLWRARVAALLTALHPGLIIYSALVMTEPLAALLLLLGGLLALRPGLWGIGTAGLAFGIGALVRPPSLLVLAFLSALSSGPCKTRLLRSVAIGLVSFAVILPWTLRNCLRMDGCALISTNGGWNLAIGALTESGRFQTLRAREGCSEVHGQVEQDRCWAGVAWLKIRSDPGHWLGLIPKKLSQTYDHESFAVEYLREAEPQAWPEPRRRAYREWLTAFHGLLLVAASGSVVGRPAPGVHWLRRIAWQSALAAALAALLFVAVRNPSHPVYLLPTLLPIIAILPLPGRPSQGKVGGYLMGLLAATSLTHAGFFGEDRYHLVVTPALCILAAAALRRSSPDGRSEKAGPSPFGCKVFAR